MELHRLIYNLERSPGLLWRPVEIRRASSRKSYCLLDDLRDGMAYIRAVEEESKRIRGLEVERLYSLMN